MTDDSALVQQIAHEYWEGVLERDPVTATFYGDHRYRDRLPDVGPTGWSRTASDMAQMLRRLEGVAPERLNAAEYVTFEMLRSFGQDELLGIALRTEQLGVDQLSGPQIWLAELVGWHRLTEPGDTEALIARFQAFPGLIRDYIENLRQGLANGRAAFHMVVDRVITQLEGLLATPVAQSPLIPRGRVSDADLERISAVIEQTIYPAYRELHRFLREEYRPHARTAAGLATLRGGEELYAYLVRVHTTTDLTPSELHQIGLDELAQIEEEARQIGDRLGIRGELGEIVAQLNQLPDNIPPDRATIVATSERLMGEIQSLLPKAFGRLPKTPCSVKPIEEYREADAPGAYYYPPADDGSRPGVFYVNTYRPETRPLHELPALVAHEGVPGHHLQIAIAQETEGLPTFRRLSTGCTAYVEGWALYSERLADELGLYQSDRDRIGMLQAQAWRAVRLVVDTGMHQLGWGRDQAIQFFQQHVGSHESEAAVEIDRYIAWPGQALAYKTGQRVIEQLRREAQERYGPSFDLRAFHDEILRHGAVPLRTLERVMRRWMDQQAA